MDEFRDLKWGAVQPKHLDYKNAEVLFIGEKSFPETGDHEATAEELNLLEEEDEKRVAHLEGMRNNRASDCTGIVDMHANIRPMGRHRECICGSRAEQEGFSGNPDDVGVEGSRRCRRRRCRRGAERIFNVMAAYSRHLFAPTKCCSGAICRAVLLAILLLLRDCPAVAMPVSFSSRCTSTLLEHISNALVCLSV